MDRERPVSHSCVGVGAHTRPTKHLGRQLAKPCLLPLGSAPVRPSPSTCMQTTRFPWARSVVICTRFVCAARPLLLAAPAYSHPSRSTPAAAPPSPHNACPSRTHAALAGWLPIPIASWWPCCARRAERAARPRCFRVEPTIPQTRRYRPCGRGNTVTPYARLTLLSQDLPPDVPQFLLRWDRVHADHAHHASLAL
ncbi:hypothetical protein P171DRAFT_98193 [Karstenula rhodostoma CBS 690.94]|uniref:Uncharacterized protein n=1 Tax=Karstenula rhodostoma CBS 690.94 TaxID=1392251 RepID=A0A9P4PAJ3_9PLEO|nr:hypothetical protein P171DRAFT_98193 [Karstenula rhodostoma CBS 690.94]